MPQVELDYFFELVLKLSQVELDLNSNEWMNSNFSGLSNSLDRFDCSAAFSDPRGRYKRGGGVNVPVRLTVELPIQETL